MTEQQFNRACEINERLKALERVKSKFQFYDLRLCFSYEDVHSEVKVFVNSAMDAISDLLDKHDKMIQQEIEDEIESLKKEIEKL